MLFLFGDPRGRGSFGNNFMLFPIWKIARQTCILENSLTNENFKEMFHCQDFIFKIMLDVSGNGTVAGTSANPAVNYNNYYDGALNYTARREFTKRNYKRKLTNKNRQSQIEKGI